MASIRSYGCRLSPSEQICIRWRLQLSAAPFPPLRPTSTGAVETLTPPWGAACPGIHPAHLAKIASPSAPNYLPVRLDSSKIQTTMPKTYFLAPTRDSPPSGPIALGNIIKLPRTPEMALNNRNSEAMRRLLSNAVAVKEQATTRNLSSRSGFASGVWASFLAFTGLGAGVGVQLEDGKAASYQIDTLISVTINPDMADIKAIFAEREVQASLRSSRFNSNLYMITGVQIARGTDYMITAARNRGKHLHLSADLTPLCTPVAVGVGAQAARGSDQVVAGHIQHDFVFAYRLREILYKRKVVNEQRDYPKGDLYAKGGERRENSRLAGETGESPQEYQAEVLDLQPEDPDLPDVWDMDAETARDMDGDEVLCVHVTGDDEDF
ncbi:hypothetical protein DL769_004432 [Monosporascus sp. CRB-8-3]|nr:hypothetical protein DL769_004432 [Monosporascus sp. CRB-8-3]